MHIAKRFYGEKFDLLQEKLIAEYELVQTNQSRNFNILSKLLISGEDHRFYYHIGFDLIAIARAIRNRIVYRKIEGASTIEQQLVRVLTNDFDRSVKRKLQEILLATTVTAVVPKCSVPSIYLNVAYYGTGMNSLDKLYSKLGIPYNAELKIEQAAEIISRIKYPQSNGYNKKRLRQIEIRKKHLIKLHHNHSKRKYFRIHG